MKAVFIALGFLSVSIGAIGAVLPVLPTTPFLLLGSYFFAKGSDRFDTWLKGTKLYKDNLESFEKNRSMTRKTKIYLMTLSSSMIWLSVFMVDKIYLKAMLIMIDLFKYYYFIFVIKTEEESVD
ncbi:YbaN family protein [Gudongella sp. DL1XJH-153]|uniref:YbaN family protein n=1 Tax=Gudongella sp. DL1XJH-153 TaxID=3409804 RepID=UPI003BB595C6